MARTQTRDLILSIGTGPERDLTLSNAAEEFLSPFWLRLSQKILTKTFFYRLQLVMYSLMLMTNTERPHINVQEDVNTLQRMTSGSTADKAFPRIYFRLNVEDGSARVPLDACDKIDQLIDLAQDYISQRKQELDQIATILLKTEIGDQDGFPLPPVRSALADDSSEDNSRFETFLMQAERGDEKEVKALLEKGADVNVKDFRRQTALMKAAHIGHEAVVRLLLTTGQVEVDSRDEDGWTSLSWAAYIGHEGRNTRLS